MSALVSHPRIEGARSGTPTRPRWRIKNLPLELTDTLIADLKNIYLITDFGMFDCISEVKGIGTFDEVLKHSQLMQFPFGRCHVLNVPALIRAKEAIGRPQDMLVVAQLRAIQERYGSA